MATPHTVLRPLAATAAVLALSSTTLAGFAGPAQAGQKNHASGSASHAVGVKHKRRHRHGAASTAVADPATLALLVAKKQYADADAQEVAACYYPTSAKCLRMTTAADEARANVVTLKAVAPVGADTLYVAPTGSDSAPGAVDQPVATLTEALRRAYGGERVVVAGGNYAKVTDTRARTAPVTVTGPGGSAASIAGMAISGGQDLDLSGLRFTNGVAVRDHTTISGQPARDIRFHENQFTSSSTGTCISVRNGSQDLSIVDNTITGCQVGISGAAGGTIAQSTGLLIQGNTIQHLTGDGIQLGQWSDITITQNTIDDLRDPANVYHNDGIQFTGNVYGAVITQNRISNSRTQLIFIQDAVGPIDDVTVENNVLQNAGAVSMQSLGATRARYIHNTVVGGLAGGLWLGKGSVRNGVSVVPTDTVAANNITSNMRINDGARAAVSAGNVGACWPGNPPTTDPATGWSCVTDVGFVDPATNLALAPGSVVRAMGVASPTSTVDVTGALRTGAPVPGAFR